MKKYFVKISHNSDKRGYNRTVSVYTQNKDGSFSFIAENDKINTASYRGDSAEANQILHDNFGYKWAEKGNTHYYLLSKNVKLIFLP